MKENKTIITIYFRNGVEKVFQNCELFIDVASDEEDGGWITFRSVRENRYHKFYTRNILGYKVFISQ